MVMPPDLSAWFGLLSSFAFRSSVKLRASIARSRQLLRPVVMNDVERVSNKNWTMLLFYRSVWNDMVSQQN